MTAIQRSACLSLVGLAYGRAAKARAFARSMQRRAESNGWHVIELTPKQVRRLAKQVRRYRRQIKSPDLLFWAQRTLAEAQPLFPLEASCPTSPSGLSS
jgi:hypothetical protein